MTSLVAMIAAQLHNDTSLKKKKKKIQTVFLFPSPAGVRRVGCDHVRDGDRVPAPLGARHFRSL